ncbi:energy-coupling factor ABC transporter substrate-binding protein [Clostridium chauvoei]|uniref:energy-coupling factor ABC transporter substrate-binding protein n=1 Tax=Clostridium chauvoei TaxID=46867 RepID=UPI0020796843|nr:energy-coupling factor ABC transporter substrate-binding protein [Clostridium chauvoei]
MKKKNLTLFIICILLIVGPFIISKNGEFVGADEQAEGLITEINSDYEPWFESLWEPPSGEVESFLFSMQAAIGAGFIGYFVGKKKHDTGNKSV